MEDPEVIPALSANSRITPEVCVHDDTETKRSVPGEDSGAPKQKRLSVPRASSGITVRTLARYSGRLLKQLQSVVM